MSTKKQKNIFIVEDNIVFTLALKSDIETAFANQSVKVQSFESGEACMKKYREEKPQVVILDYHLNSKNPDAANGLKVLDWIKTHDENANVIILTGDDNIETALKSFKHGAFDYIVKTETKFKKINNSLFNLFSIMEAKREAKRYRMLSVGVMVAVGILILSVIAIRILEPSILS